MSLEDETAGAPEVRLETEAVPGVATPDQTRPDGMIPDPGTLAKADTSGIIEDRKRKGNLTGT